LGGCSNKKRGDRWNLLKKGGKRLLSQGLRAKDTADEAHRKKEKMGVRQRLFHEMPEKSKETTIVRNKTRTIDVEPGE